MKLNIIKKHSAIYFFLKKVKTKVITAYVYGLSKSKLENYIGRLYKKYTGYPMNWDAPKTYTEKIQWQKVHGNISEIAPFCDKYSVRTWVENRIGKKYLIPLLGKWDNFSEIDFDSLPNQFVLKTNCASGDAIIVRNKKALKAKDFNRFRRQLNYYLNYGYGLDNGEFQYQLIKPCIIAEKYIESGQDDLPDYKFFCFNGKPYFCWVDVGRYHDHRRNVYDLNWNLQKWNQETYKNTEYPIQQPSNLNEMIDVVKILCKDFQHVRVDIYNVKGKIYFGEMTFSSCSGFGPIIPRTADYMLGRLWK